MTPVIDTYELSPMQAGMLFHAISGGDRGVDLQQIVITLPEPFNEADFLRAWKRVAERHAVLRTRFRWEGVVEPVQDVLDHVQIPVERFDWCVLTEAERHERFQALLDMDRVRGLDLGEGPLMRLALVRMAEREYWVLWTFHHGVLDGRSFPLVLREVFAFYETLSRGEDVELPLPRPYREHIEWLRKLDHDAAKSYWRGMLSDFGAPTPLVVARDQSGPVAGTDRGSHEIRLPAALTSALRERAREASVTLNTLLQGAWALLLHRYSGESDVVFGATRACRRSTVAGAEDIVGLLINTLPLRVRIDPEAELVPWLQQLRAQQVALRDYENTPLVNVQGWSEVPRGTPLFESILVFDNQTLDAQLRALGGTWSERRFQYLSQTNFPLTVAAYGDQELLLQMEYSRLRFDHDVIERMLGHLQMLLEGMATHPQARLKDLPLLTQTERHQILQEWNNTGTHYPADALIHELFEAHAKRTPGAAAVVSDGRMLSYRELDRRANQLAHALRKRGVGPDVLVALCVNRTADMIVAILGVLKAGGAYVPLDPDYPAERLAFMLEDCAAKVLVTEANLRASLPSLPAGCEAIYLDSDANSLAAERQDKPHAEAGPSNLAYAIYTSGSTGQPKAALITHRGLASLALSEFVLYGIGPQSRVLQFSSLSFDASLSEIAMALCSGAALYVEEREAILPGPDLERYLEREKITVLSLTPSALAVLDSTAGPCLEQVIVGGEPCSVELAERWAHRCRFFNTYGPTEATIVTTYVEYREGALPPLIGRPLPNVRVYLLDPALQPVPVGVPGELYVGGIGVARGYLNRPKLNAQRFLPDPFRGGSAAVMYRTGDFVRWRSDGQIDFIGRMDDQVKIRGFRIELGEIESALNQHSAVKESVVVVWEDAPGDKRLVAYVIPANPYPALVGELRSLLKEQLPGYMVPAAFVLLDALPLTPNGKLDRKALPPPKAERQVEQTVIAPLSELEQQIAKVWREMLHLEQVGVSDNFFDLGGHSLLLVKVCARLREELNCKLKVTDLFTYPTIEALANHLGDATRTDALAEDALARVSRRSGGSGQAEPIAIVGMAGRFPGAGDIETFWANLRDGKESITFFSAEEMRESGVPVTLLGNPSYVGAWGYLENADKFDAGFFGYSAREAEIIDPQQRLLLECAAEVLERAGYDPDRYQGLIGIYAGASQNTYVARVQAQHNASMGVDELSNDLANGQDFLTTRVSYKLNLRGPSVNVQTACSTSLVAVHQACRALRDQECDMALAGGVSVTVPLKSGYLYVQEGIGSPDGHCRAFDAGANGTVRGSGVAMVMLKRFSEALADGDPIHAVIRGTAINNDGSSKVGYTAPSVEGQAQVIALAQASAQCDPDTIGYMEAHGTGTLLGDPIEVAALTRVFGDGRRRRSACWLGALKTNIGHLDAAAGVAGLIKAALSLEHKELVPSLNFGNPNPQIDFAAGPFKVSTELRKWDSPAGVLRRAGVSSFGLGGTNAHAVLEEAPARESSGPSREWQLLCLSAKTDAALARATANLARHLSEHPDINLADAAYTLQLGRREFSHRCVVVCRDVADALSALGGGIAQRLIRSVQKGGTRSVQFMFTGQGAQYPNMGLGLYRTEALFRETVDYCCERLKSRLGLDLREVLFPAEDVLARAAERIKQTELTQPALFTIEYALAKLWMSLGIQPAAMIGHSIGEYVAACLAGVMSLDDALDLVAERGRLMGQLPPGSMLAIPLSEEQVLPLLSEQLSLAGINSPNLCIVSGPQADIAALEARLVEMELAPRRLHTSHAFHSSMMDPILEPFTRRVSRIPLHPPQLPYISNVTGQWITAEQATDPAYYATHLRQAVQFSKGLEQLFADPNCVFLEIGPGHTLTALAKRHPAHKEEHAFIASLRHADEAQADEAVLMESVGRLWLAGLRADWRALHGNNRRRRVRLPTYPFEQIRYWLEPAKASVGKASVGRQRIGRTANSAEWTYVPSWRRAPTASSASNKREANWLVFADNHGLGSQLETHLIDGGARVVSVAVGERFAMKAPGKYVLNSAAREDYDRLLAELKAASFTPNFIAHLWSVRRNEELRQDEDFSAECKDLGFFSLIFLAQALDACEVDGPLGLAVLTSHVHDVDGSERICPENALVLGPCKVIGMEHPNIRARSIDLAVDGDLRWLGQALANDLCAPWTEPVVAYRGKYRWVQEFEQVQVHYAKATPTLVRDSGVYLIAGGLGLIGLGIAEFLARTARARLVLLSRSGLPERVHWARWLDGHDGDDTVGRTIRRVLAMESSGAKVLVYTVDVADESRMREVIAEAEARFGALCGVVHAAGAEVRLSPIQTLRRADCEVQFRAKLQGLRVLERVLRNKRLDFCLVNSSLASVMGVMEFASYTASHLFMDAFVIQHNRVEGAPWRVVNWDHWVTEGPGAEKQSYYMRPGEATEVLSRFLSMPDSAQVLVSTGDLQGRIDQVILREEPQTDEPEVEASQISQGHPRPALSSQYEAPRNDAERLLADIWAKMLGIAQVGIHDNFFELGGDSVINIQITARANQAGLRFTPKQAFEHQTIAALAAIADAGSAITNEQGAVTGPVPLTPIQRWFFDLNLKRPQHFNQPMLLEVRRPLDVSILAQVVERLERHHDALRLRFFKGKEGWKQQLVEPTGAIKVHKFELARLTGAEQERRIEAMGTELQTSMDLAKGPLLQVAYFDLGPGRPGRLLLAIHHLVVDMISWRFLLEDMGALYESLSRGRDVTLPAKTASIKRWAEALTEYAQTKAAEAELGYWMDIAAKPILRLPVDFEAGANTVGSSASIHEELSVEETRALLTDLPRAYKTQINDALLLALVKAVCGWTGGSSVFVDLEGHGRGAMLNDIDVSRTVGWFTTLGLVRLELPAAKGLCQQIRSVQAQLQTVPHQGMGFGVLRYLSAKPVVTGALEKLPRPEISFLYMGQFDQGFSSDSMFVPASESVGPVNDPEGERDHLLEIDCIVSQGRLQTSWTYSRNRHWEARIRSLAQTYMAVLRSLIASCQNVEARDDAATGFKDSGVSDSDLAEISRQLGG